MIDTIILLTEPAVEEALTGALRRYNPRLTICPANSAEQLAAIDPKLIRRARLLRIRYAGRGAGTHAQRARFRRL